MSVQDIPQRLREQMRQLTCLASTITFPTFGAGTIPPFIWTELGRLVEDRRPAKEGRPLWMLCEEDRRGFEGASPIVGAKQAAGDARSAAQRASTQSLGAIA